MTELCVKPVNYTDDPKRKISWENHLYIREENVSTLTFYDRGLVLRLDDLSLSTFLTSKLAKNGIKKTGLWLYENPSVFFPLDDRPPVI